MKMAGVYQGMKLKLDMLKLLKKAWMKFFIAKFFYPYCHET